MSPAEKGGQKSDWEKEARGFIVTAIEELVSLEGTKDLDLLRERLYRWRDLAHHSMQKYFTYEESRRFLNAATVSVANQTIKSVVDHSRKYLIALLETLDKAPHLILKVTRVSASPETPTGAVIEKREGVVPITTRAFIIHGHDEANLLKLERLLIDRFRLEPVILRDEPGKGRTLVEKLEDEIPRCAFAFVLMSPDDHVRVTKPDGTIEEYAQARPNVVFEMGWICGHLGRAKMCILFKRGTRIHSDLEGIHRVEFGNSVDEAIPGIERELEGASLFRRA